MFSFSIYLLLTLVGCCGWGLSKHDSAMWCLDYISLGYSPGLAALFQPSRLFHTVLHNGRVPLLPTNSPRALFLLSLPACVIFLVEVLTKGRWYVIMVLSCNSPIIIICMAQVKNFYLFIQTLCICICLCVWVHELRHWRKAEPSDALELELQAVANNLMWVSFCKSSTCS